MPIQHLKAVVVDSVKVNRWLVSLEVKWSVAVEVVDDYHDAYQLLLHCAPQSPPQLHSFHSNLKMAGVEAREHRRKVNYVIHLAVAVEDRRQIAHPMRQYYSLMVEVDAKDHYRLILMGAEAAEVGEEAEHHHQGRYSMRWNFLDGIDHTNRASYPNLHYHPT